MLIPRESVVQSIFSGSIEDDTFVPGTQTPELKSFNDMYITADVYDIDFVVWNEFGDTRFIGYEEEDFARYGIEIIQRLNDPRKYPFVSGDIWTKFSYLQSVFDDGQYWDLSHFYNWDILDVYRKILIDFYDETHNMQSMFIKGLAEQIGTKLHESHALILVDRRQDISDYYVKIMLVK